MTSGARPRVALVYPPYGPPNLPSLGLAILSAAARSSGFECRTLFWQYRLASSLPLPACTMEQKLSVYSMLTQWNFFPWNEWVFASHLFPGAPDGNSAASAGREGEIRKGLTALDQETGGSFGCGLTGNLRPSQLILYLRRKAPDLANSLASELEPYDVVGIGTTFFQTAPALALASCLKQRWPGKITVLGGANCDGEMGRALIENFPFLDCVFSGEADHSFPEFLRRLRDGAPVSDIPGLLSRDGSGRIIEGPAASATRHLDDLPVPDFDDYLAERKRFGLAGGRDLCLPLESSRGCWWGAKSHCTFCGLNGNGIGFRNKSPARFQQEVETVANRYGARRLFMADNILPASYYRDLLPKLQERSPGLHFFYEIRPTGLRKQAAQLASAGITLVQPGIESFSTKLLRLMKKGTRGIQNVAFLKYARVYGLSVVYNLLAGFPGEDPSEYLIMARQVRSLSHLQPPSGVTPVRFDRFSAYHTDPAAYGISVSPHERYFALYPFDANTVARLAFVFQATPHQETACWQPLSDAVSDWRRRFNPEICTLTWTADRDEVLISDRRAGFSACEYRLRGAAAKAYGLLDEPKALRGTAGASGAAKQEDGRNVTIAFGDEEFSADPVACLRPLVAAGLVYEENGCYLALAVESGFRRPDPGWAQLGI